MTTNPIFGACPVGTAVFFPWLTEPPNSDWVKCDGKIYSKGIYPQIDQVREKQPTNARLDKRVYFDTEVKKASSSGIEVVASSGTDTKYPVFHLFRTNDPTGENDCWASASNDVNPWVQITFKNEVVRHLTGVEIMARQHASTRYFPKVVKLQALDEGDSAWRDLTDEITLTDPGNSGLVYIPVQYPIKATAPMFRLYIVEKSVANNIAMIARMRIFGKEDDLMVPRIDRQLDSQLGVWCLRVAE